MESCGQAEGSKGERDDFDCKDIWFCSLRNFARMNAYKQLLSATHMTNYRTNIIYNIGVLRLKISRIRMYVTMWVIFMYLAKS